MRDYGKKRLSPFDIATSNPLNHHNLLKDSILAINISWYVTYVSIVDTEDYEYDCAQMLSSEWDALKWDCFFFVRSCFCLRRLIQHRSWRYHVTIMEMPCNALQWQKIIISTCFCSLKVDVVQLWWYRVNLPSLPIALMTINVFPRKFDN